MRKDNTRINAQVEEDCYFATHASCLICFVISIGGPDSLHSLDEKLHFTMNYPRSLVFLLGKLPPQLLKPSILPHWPCYKWFSNAVLSFSFLFILAEYLKNHSKS